MTNISNIQLVGLKTLGLTDDMIEIIRKCSTKIEHILDWRNSNWIGGSHDVPYKKILTSRQLFRLSTPKDHRFMADLMDRLGANYSFTTFDNHGNNWVELVYKATKSEVDDMRLAKLKAEIEANIAEICKINSNPAL